MFLFSDGDGFITLADALLNYAAETKNEAYTLEVHLRNY